MFNLLYSYVSVVLYTSLSYLPNIDSIFGAWQSLRSSRGKAQQYVPIVASLGAPAAPIVMAPVSMAAYNNCNNPCFCGNQIFLFIAIVF